MSQENVEIVRAAYENWNTGDMVSLREMYDPDAMLVRGLEGWPETFPLDDAGDSVVVRTIWRGVGHGPDLNLEWSVVCTLRRGRIFFLEYFWDHAEALEAVGLSAEQDARGGQP
jgi:ketosteroid isomerase-like protein